MRGSGPRIGYVGHGAFLPPTVVTNDDLAHVVDTDDEWIRRRTGIRTRRVLDEGESILPMAVEASRRALEDAGVAPEELGDIRVATNTWLRFPSLACRLQSALGAMNASASDTAAGCAGFIYALEEAHNKIFLERVRRDRGLIALVVGVEGLSHITDWTDRNTCVLLGDGAGAVVVREVEQGGILAIHTHAQGQHGDLLFSTPVLEGQVATHDPIGFRHDACSPRAYLRMHGTRVYPIAVETMVREVRTVIDGYNHDAGEAISVADVGYVYPHQANLRIIEQVAERLGVPLDRVYTAGIVNHGNTSTASIPLGYCDERPDGHRRPGDLEVDVAFGAGFASGAVLRQVS